MARFPNINEDETEILKTVPSQRLALIYARVSSKEQEKEGFSIPAQLKLLNEYAQGKGFQVVREFVDVETAKAAGRTQFRPAAIGPFPKPRNLWASTP